MHLDSRGVASEGASNRLFVPPCGWTRVGLIHLGAQSTERRGVDLHMVEHTFLHSVVNSFSRSFVEVGRLVGSYKCIAESQRSIARVGMRELE